MTVVGQERGHHAQGRRAGQVVQGHHQRVEQPVSQGHHAEFGEQGRHGPHQHADSRQVQHRVNEQGIGRVHHGVECVHHAHLRHKDSKKAEESSQEDKILRADLRLFPHGVLRFYLLL